MQDLLARGGIGPRFFCSFRGKNRTSFEERGSSLLFRPNQFETLFPLEIGSDASWMNTACVISLRRGSLISGTAHYFLREWPLLFFWNRSQFARTAGLFSSQGKGFHDLKDSVRMLQEPVVKNNKGEYEFEGSDRLLVWRASQIDCDCDAPQVNTWSALKYGVLFRFIT